MATAKPTKTITLKGVKATLTKDVGSALVETILELTTRAQHRVETAKTWQQAFQAAVDLIGRYARLLDDTAYISHTSIEAIEMGYSKFWQYTKPTFDQWLAKDPESRAPTKLWFRFGVANCFSPHKKESWKKGNTYFVKCGWGPIGSYHKPEMMLNPNEEIQIIEIENRELVPEDFMSWQEFLDAQPERRTQILERMSA